MAEPKKKPRPNADDLTSAVAATASGSMTASMVANAQMARTIRKDTTAKGRVERAAKAGQAAAETASQPVSDARAVAGATKARQDRKATTAQGRDQRMARDGDRRHRFRAHLRAHLHQGAEGRPDRNRPQGDLRKD